jgi:hypothetical protein
MSSAWPFFVATVTAKGSKMVGFVNAWCATGPNLTPLRPTIVQAGQIRQAVYIIADDSKFHELPDLADRGI